MRCEDRNDILVIEDPATGKNMAEDLSRCGFLISRLCPDAPRPSKSASLGPCGEPGPFSEGPDRECPRPTVVVQTPSWAADFQGLGLEPGEFVLSLSSFNKRLAALAPAAKERPKSPLVAFLLGLNEEGRPSSLRDTLEAVPTLIEKRGYRVAVLCGNLKVSGAGLEFLYRRARQKGAVFLRFTDAGPDIRQDEEGRAVITCRDETSRLPITLRPDLTVVEDAWISGPVTEAASALLRADRGPDGFLPSDNVHRLGFKTNRREVFGLLPGADPLGRDTMEDDLASCMLEIRALERMDAHQLSRAASIDPALCARCLTCYRSCPHGAVRVGERVEIAPEACFSCGICEAACPGRAISLGTPDAKARPSPLAAEAVPPIRPGALVAFGCRRSAGRARALCAHLGRELPGDLVFVPVECAGRISSQMLMDAFLADAAGVIVLACHTGNCHAERGNLDAQARVAEVRTRLGEIGLDGERILYQTLAANTGVEFAQVVQTFHERVREMEEGSEGSRVQGAE